jgi:nucleoside-diphosphate-sugar epimerase
MSRAARDSCLSSPNDAMTRVLVTGSLGYIGSVLTDYLTSRGVECVGYDTEFFADSLLYPASPTEARARDARDIREDDLDGVDVVVHLAGISNDPMGKLEATRIYDPTRAYSLSIARLCKQRGVRFIFASSCSVYGAGGSDLLNELSPTSPQTHYSLNKLQVEEDLRSISDAGFSPIALRFATVFGSSPRLRLDVVVNMLTGMAAATGSVILNSDGRSWRPNVHILDACQAIHRAIDLDYTGGELLVLNVGDERNNLQILDIAKIVQNAFPGCELRSLMDNPELDREGLIRDRKIKGGVDTRTYKVSFERIRRTLPGFACEWTVEQGVREMANRFDGLSFNEAMFKRRGFYRLQELEYLYENGFLSDELRWLKARPSASRAPAQSHIIEPARPQGQSRTQVPGAGR